MLRFMCVCGALSGDTFSIEAPQDLLRTIERTQGGSYSFRKGVFLPSMRLLDSPFLEPLRRTLLRTLSPFKIHCKMPSQNPS